MFMEKVAKVLRLQTQVLDYILDAIKDRETYDIN
jgi:hypothetical protein